MTPGTKLALIMCLALAAALLPGTQSFARTAVELVGETSFTAAETSRTTIRFPHAVKWGDLRYDVEGNGRVYGFMLQKVGKYDQEGERPVVQGLTIGQCSERGCKAAKDGYMFITGFNVGRAFGGMWDFAVIADGAPVTVTLRIKGVSGRRVVPVSGSVASDIRTLTPRVHETATNTIYSAGDFAELRNVDFGLVGLWAIGAPHASSAWGSCLYYDYESVVPSPEEEHAFMPGCPTGDGYESAWPMPGPSGGFVATAGAYDRTKGLGGWYATASLVERYGAVGFWIDF